jgi:hypothetical protein
VPISSLVLTLAGTAASQQGTLERLRRNPQLTLGAANGARVPLVIDCARVAEERRLLDELRADPAITHVDVVFVEVEPPAQREEESDDGPQEREPR